MKKITAIYNANGGLVGEISYFIGKLAGKHWALCDITHGSKENNMLWKKLENEFKIPIKAIHINEMTEKVKNFVGDNTPIVVFEEDDDDISVLMDKIEIEKCGKDVNKFFEILNEKIKLLKFGE